ncbi:MAG: two-component system, chemotaxis family, sensor kinase CheA [Gammaproteobacteria bacterium]|jgi:signal transduction histidine kinase|nr:two-component system, chemotaxis family, sensor kinase CheA [Gammaproteobacteria bacterium]
MFIMGKRRKRDNQSPDGDDSRLADALLKSTPQGLFLLDAKDKVLAPVSPSLATLFRRQDFANLTFEKLLAPLVTPKTLTAARNQVAALLSAAAPGAPPAIPAAAGATAAHALGNIDVRLKNSDGSYDAAHYSFEFEPIEAPDEARVWLVRVTDITARVQANRELEELRIQIQTQGEILRSVLQMGGARFGAFMQKTDASMNAIGTVLKKPAREEAAFRNKLEEILNEVDRIRREAAAFRLTALQSAARVFEDALQNLRLRSALSGSDFLPLAVKLDQLYGQFALVKTLTAAPSTAHEADAAGNGAPTTHGGTAVMEAPNFTAAAAEPKPKTVPGAHQTAPAGSLGSTLQALTEHVAQEHNKQVLLETSGLHLVPQKYLAAVKNVAIQLIRNAVMHGIEPPAVRKAAGKNARGMLRLEFKTKGENFELLFEDDGCGLVPDQVRATAIARGVLPEEAAARLRDREVIKLIFKSRFTTLADSPTDTRHGAGMSLVRRYIHEAGGKIALASLAGHETRFKIVLPQVADSRAA